MKQPILILAAGLVLSLCSCASDEDRAKETVSQFVESVNQKNFNLQKQVFPKSIIGSCQDLNLSMDGATVTKRGETFIVTLPGSIEFFVKESSGKFVIEDSRMVLVQSLDTTYDSSMNGIIERAFSSTSKSEGIKYGIAIKTGMINGKGIDSDVTLLEKLGSLSDNSDFIMFLKRKYPDAMQGNMKTLDIKQKRIRHHYRVDILSESGGNVGGYVGATVYNKEGKRVARKVGEMSASVPGDRQSTMILFNSDVVGNVGKIEVDYIDYILDNLNDLDCLLFYAPLSPNDYQEFLNLTK